APSSRLESPVSNRKFGDAGLPFAGAVVLPKKCRCRTCAKGCGCMLGCRVRQNMLRKTHHFRKPAMLSLTVDRSHFASSQDAHSAICEGGYLRRLLRLLGVTTWFWVLEFQTRTGDGWPHWHILI